jgi:dihydrofolate reductase
VGRIVVMNSVTLDGVMQSPGRADEDTSEGFRHGGWAISDPDSGAAWSERMAAGGGLAGWLFGRRTYEDVLGYWTQQSDSPFGAALTKAAKYVVSSTLTDPSWPNTEVLSGPPAESVAELKNRVDGVLALMGSGQLIEAMLPQGLIDEFLLTIHPLVLGSGRRLFPEGSPLTRFECVDARRTDAGLLVATYQLRP